MDNSSEALHPLQQYTMLSVIGKGSYAKVSLVRKKKNGFLYALKSMKKKYLEAKKYEGRALLQKQILATIDHPFLVTMESAFQDQKKLFLVLEYCPGGQLFKLLRKRKRLTEDQARFYSAQIILALEYLHENNIIYRDLKPENILIDQFGYLKLTDFGLSKNNVFGEKDEFSVCGTPQYMAPQIIKKEGHGKSVDWWCLGSLIYQLVFGIPPFFNKNRNHMFDKIKFDQPDYPKNWSKKLKSLLALLLEKDPEIRLLNAAEIKTHPWFSSIDWDSLLKKEMKPYFIPKIDDDTDVQNFDRQFTECSLESQSSSYDGNRLSGFSFGLSSQHSESVDEEIIMNIQSDQL